MTVIIIKEAFHGLEPKQTSKMDCNLAMFTIKDFSHDYLLLFTVVVSIYNSISN